MKYLFTTILLAFLTTNLMADPPEVSAKFEKELSKHFDIESIKMIEIKELTNDDDLFFNIYSKKKDLGIAVLTSAKGRYDKFDYMVVYNLNFEVELIKILVYRSEYGSEITAKRWLSQFYSKQTGDLIYGNDIQAISGATFSAISLTKNINRINNKIVKDYKKRF